MNSKIWIQTHHPKNITNMYFKEFQIAHNVFNIPFDIRQYRIVDVNDKLTNKNINSLSRFFNEYCQMYYVWKNNIQSDIVSFSHYSRIITYSHIETDFLINNDYIQYYDQFELEELYTILYKSYDLEFNPNLYFSTVITSHTNYPKFIIDDFNDYLNLQNIVDQYDIHRYLDYHPGSIMLARKTMFSSSWSMFDKFMRFANGYYEYIFNKYNLDWNEEIIHSWYLNNIVNYYREFNFNKLKENIEITLNNTFFKTKKDTKNNRQRKEEIIDNLMKSARCYSSESQYNLIFDAETQFGYNSYCNIWRMFGYLCETLGTIFIMSQNNFKSFRKELYTKYSPDKSKYPELIIF